MHKPAEGLRLFVVVIIACGLMIVDHRYVQFNQFRNKLSLVVYPIQKVVDFPFYIAQTIGGFFATQESLFAENQKLRQEHLLLQAKLQKLDSLETENNQLRQLLGSGSQLRENLLVANVINVDPNPFTHQILINRGTEDQVYAGQPIIDADGVMGTITEVGAAESRALLITDAGHAIPVEDVRNGVRAIAVGTGSGNLELRHVPNSIDINVGDVMVTSGLGGKFPVGFPVGKVKEVKHDPSKPFATIVLQPSAKLDRSRHILLIQNAKTPGKGNKYVQK